MNYTYDMATTTLMINNQFVASQRAFFDIWLGMFRLMAIWLGVLVVLGIIALVVWLVIRNKRKASSVPAQDPNLKTPGLATASLVLGIISLLPNFGIVCGILALIFGLVAKNKIAQGGFAGKGMATAGVICGITGIVLSIVFMICMFGLIASSLSQLLQ